MTTATMVNIGKWRTIKCTQNELGKEACDWRCAPAFRFQGEGGRNTAFKHDKQDSQRLIKKKEKTKTVFLPQSGRVQHLKELVDPPEARVTTPVSSSQQPVTTVPGDSTHILNKKNLF